MSGSSLGNKFHITTWGESHGPAIGVVIDGCPSGLPLCSEDIQLFLDRRKPGQSKYTTQRQETDKVEILSGVFNEHTTGTPISLIVYNHDQHSKDYGNIASCYRPGHADYTFDEKYGFRDYRGGGRSSGRETIGRVAAGAIAAKILCSLGITFTTYTKSIGPISVPEEMYEFDNILKNSLYMPNSAYAEKAIQYLDTCMKEQDSAGGIVECRVHHLPPGIGSPVFNKLEALLSRAIMSIGAVKGFEIGDGFHTAVLKGSTNNDSFCINAGQIQKKSNHSGGTLGGISDGDTLVFRAAIKPTPSIGQAQDTVSQEKEAISLAIKGRHDPVIVPRAVVVVESMAAITILDLLFEHMGSRMEYLSDFYNGGANHAK